MSPPPNSAIQVGERDDGSVFYLVPGSPAALPAVRGRDLLAAWDAARGFAAHGAWGQPRCFRFLDPEADIGTAPTDIALTDPDARSWAAAADARAGLHTRYGLSLGLRLLALVDLLTRNRHAQRLLTVQAGQAELHPALVAAAAATPLDAQARFDEIALLAGLPGTCELLSPTAHKAEPTS